MRFLARSIAISLCLVVVQPRLHAQQPRNSTNALRDSLVAIVLDFYAGWEPQSGTLEQAIARGRKYFVTDSSFAMIIDTTYRYAFDQWATRTAVSIPNAYQEYREQHHHVRAAKVLPLGSGAAALTMMYCVEFVKKDGTHGIANSGATLVFVRASTGWRIAQYHGTHGPETVTSAKCPS